MRSASRHHRWPALAACCAVLLAGVSVGCSTTQEKAAKHQAEAERILEARAERQQQRKENRKKNEGKAENGQPQKDGGQKQ